MKVREFLDAHATMRRTIGAGPLADAEYASANMARRMPRMDRSCAARFVSGGIDPAKRGDAAAVTRVPRRVPTPSRAGAGKGRFRVRLGRASAYAVLATVHIAEQGRKGPMPVRAISDTCNIPLAHLQKLLQQLVRARILASERGPSGGFELRRPADQITLLDVVEAIDGPILGEVAGASGVDGKRSARQALQNAVNDVARHTKAVLKKASVRDLMSSAGNRG